MRWLLALTMVALLGGVASADEFDPEGWKYLGRAWFDAHEDGDQAIPIPLYSGSVGEIAIVAETGTAKVTKVLVSREGGAKQTLEPDEFVKQQEGALVLALEAAAIPIKSIWVTTTDRTDKTRLLIFGRDPSASPRGKVDWDHTGWLKIDKGKVRYSSASMGSGEGTAMAMIAIVSEAEIDLSHVAIRIDDALTLRDEQVTSLAPGEPYLVDVSNEPQPVVVGGVTFEGVVTGALESKVAIYGLPSTSKLRPKGRILRRPSKEEAAQAAADASKWEDLGWTLLGEDDVDLIDDEIEVPKKQKGTWRQVKVVVVGDAVKLRTLDLHLGGKKSKVQSEKLEQTYGDDDDSVVIDIPGKRRAIKKVRLQYKKHKLDASTRVQIYAR